MFFGDAILKSFIKKYLPLLGALIFIVLIVNLIINRQYAGFFYYAFLVLHTITVFVNIFLFFRPTKSILYGVTGILYLPVLVFSKTYELNILVCYILILVSFWNQGFFVKQKTLKRTRAIAGIIAIVIIRIFLLKDEYLHRLFAILPVLFVSAVLLMFVLDSYRFEKILHTKFTVNLDEYANLSDRQKKLAIAILNGIKYDSFARENSISISAIKKDALSIFKTFSCSNKNIFEMKFSQYDFTLGGELVFKGSLIQEK